MMKPNNREWKFLMWGFAAGVCLLIASLIALMLWSDYSSQQFLKGSQEEKSIERTPKINCTDRSKQLIQQVEAGVASSTPKVFFNPASSLLSHKFENLKHRNKSVLIKQEFRNVSLDYPEFISEDPKVASLNSYIKDIIYNQWKADEEDANSENTYFTAVDLTSTYKVYGVVNDIVSIELILTDFTNGGNGNHDNPIAILYDLKKGRPLKTSELFCRANYPEALYAYAYNDACINFPAKGYELDSVEYWPDDSIYPQGWIDHEFDPKTLYNYEDILLERDGVVIIFSPYTVASGAAGILKAKIDYSKLPNTICLPS